MKSVIREVANKLRLDQYADTYGMRRSRARQGDDADTIMGVYEPTDWLSVEDTLDAQNIAPTDDVLFCKRFVDRIPTLAETNATDEHLTFSQARSEILSGHHDAVLFAELQIELAAILLLHSAGRHDVKLPPTYVQDNAASILSPRWRKKPKSEMLSRIGMTHIAMSGLPWAFDPRAIKLQFVQSMTKASTYGAVSFLVEAARLSDGGSCAAAVISISSQRVVIKTKKGSSSNGFDKDSSEPLFTQPVANISLISVVRTLFTFSFPGSEGAHIFVTLVSKDAAIVRDNISGFANAAALRVAAASLAKPIEIRERSNSKKNLKQSSSNESLYTKALENGLVDAGTIQEMITQGSALISQAEKDLTNVVLLQKQSKEGRRLSSDDIQTANSPRTISQWFTKAATHLSSVSRGVSALEKKLRNGIFFNAEESAKSIASIAQWCTAIQLVSHCLIKSSNQTATGIQTIAEVARNIVGQAKIFLALVTAVEAAVGDLEKESQLKFELSIAERALTSSCGALDLALQGRISDETSIVSLLTCCRDIESASSQMLKEAMSDSASSGSDLESSHLRLETSKAAAIFSWYGQMLAACSPVLFKDDNNVAGKVHAGIESIDSAATTLLSLMLEHADAVDDSESAPRIKRLNASWGSTNQSTKMFLALSATAQLPASDLDPMMPAILYHLSGATEQLACRFTSLSKKTMHLIESVSTQSAAVVRSLAILATVEPNPMILSLSSKIEGAVDALRNAVRASSTKNLKRLTPDNAYNYRKSVATASLAVLDAATAAVSDVRFRGTGGSADSLQMQLKLLVMNLLHLRSLFRIAANPFFETDKSLDASFIQHILEQLDVMAHGITPTLGYFISQGSSAADLDSLLAEWQQSFQSLAADLNASTPQLGLFAPSVEVHKLRLLSRFESCRALAASTDDAPTVAKRKSGGSSANTEVMRIKRKSGGSQPTQTLQRKTSGLKLAIRATNLTSSLGKSDSLSPRSPLGSIRETKTDDPSEEVLDRGEEGTLEAVNEAGLLKSLQHVMESGEIKGGCTQNVVCRSVSDLILFRILVDLSFKDALDLFLVTFPYWSEADRITDSIISPLMTMKDRGLSDTEEKHMGMRISIALSRYLRLHPQILHEPSCRLAVNSAVAAFKAISLDDGARAVEDTMRECFESLSSFERLKEELGAPLHDLPRIDLLTVDLQVLAEQLTVVEQRFFDAVTVPDLLRSAWSKKTNALSIWITHSNHLSRWVASRILQTPSKRDRAKLVGRFMKLTEHLRKLSNFSTMVTIFLALSLDCIARLRKTWEAGAGTLNLQLLKLNESIRPLSNFSSYREDLKNAQSPCIPYMAVLLRDLVTLEEIVKEVELPNSPRNGLGGSSGVGGSGNGGASGVGADSASPANSPRPGEDVFNFPHLSTIMRVVQSQFARFKKTRHQLAADPKLYLELLRPDAFELIAENELGEFSVRLEPEKARASRSLSTVPPPSTPTRRTATSLGLTVDVNSKAVYGVRSQMSPTSPPTSPTQSVAERLGLSSPRSPPLLPWRRHLSNLAIQMENACLSLNASGKPKAAQFAQLLLEHFTNILRQSDSPRSRSREHSRVLSAGNDEDGSAVPLNTLLDLSELISGCLADLKFKWIALADSEEDLSQYYLSKHRSVVFESTLLQLLTASLETLNPANSAPSKAVRRVAVTPASDSEGPTMSFVLQLKFQDLPALAPTVEDDIMTLLSPSASKYFHNWRGAYVVKSYPNGLTKFHLELTTPIRKHRQDQ